jgi:hypothetical protein
LKEGWSGPRGANWREETQPGRRKLNSSKKHQMDGYASWSGDKKK